MRKESKEATPFLDNQPTLFPDLEPYWNAFWIINNTRTSGLNGANPISLLEISAYLNIFEVENPKDFIPYIYILDQEFLAYIHELSSGKKK